MKIARVKTEKYNNYEEGDAGTHIKVHFKKDFWKSNDRKTCTKNVFKKDKDYE